MEETVYKVKKINGPVDIDAKVPSSKSVLARALILGALSDGKCTLNNVVLSQDTRTMMVALRDLGFSVFFSAGLKQIRIQGMNGEIPNKNATIFVGNSGTAARFLTGMLAFSDGTYVVNASPQMEARPMKELIQILRKLGVKITCLKKDGHFPIKIEGKKPKDNKDIEVVIDITRSTQFVSSLLMILPIMNCNSKVITVGSSRDAYIQMTNKMIDRFGLHVSSVAGEYHIEGGGKYNSGVYEIEPDVSSACYFYAMAMLHSGRAHVEGVGLSSVQGDLEFVKLLQDLGAEITEDENRDIVLTYDGKKITGDRVIDMVNYSDQAATLSVIAATIDGVTTIDNVAHIRHQECDRIAVIKENLNKCGIECEEYESGMRIKGATAHGGNINPHNDHRMAMSFSILGSLTGDSVIEDYECVEKTFAEFYEELEKVH